MPDGTVQRFGPAEPRFDVTLKNKRALRAIASIDEGRIGDAYLAGDIDIDGDMLAPFELRGSMSDFHLDHGRLALPPAAALRAGLYQSAGDHRALRYRSGFLPEFSRPEDPLLHAGRLRRCGRNARCRDAPKVRLLLPRARSQGRRPHSRDRSGVGRLVRICLGARRQMHRDNHLAGLDRLSRQARQGTRPRLGADQRRPPRL